MKILIVIFVLSLVFFSACTKDSTLAMVDSIPSCVLPEVSTDTISSEGIFLSGNQSDGFAKGMKMDKKFEACTEVFIQDSTHSSLYLYTSTYWVEVSDFLHFVKVL